MIGARYCSRPIVVSGTRIAAAPNRISGIAVAMPPPASSAAWSRPSLVYVPLPVTPRTGRVGSAGPTRYAGSTADALERLSEPGSLKVLIEPAAG
jgi:hypothetical protein